MSTQETPKPQTSPIDSRTLLGDKRAVLIVHDGEVYRLQVTANNRLILTK